MPSGTFQRLIAIIEQAFNDLQVEIPQRKVEELAITVHRAMTSRARNFHTLEHVFTFVNPDNPIQTLAALYHDIVYYQVDLGFTPDIWNIIRSDIEFLDDHLHVCRQVSPQDRSLAVLLDVFDFCPGQKLSIAGELNEFLSALVLSRQLEDVLSEKDLLTMMLCIEATVPFRGIGPDGTSHFDVLESRLRRISESYQIAFTEQEIEDAIRLSVMFANKDIENFGEIEPGRFIDNTWKLLPEMNIALRARDVYSICEYREALQNMGEFLGSLNPDNVFNQYKGTPPPEKYNRMSRRARQNIRIANEYLEIKLVGLAILDALAQVTGGDAPLSLFVGDQPLSENNHSSRSLDDYLPDLSIPPWIDNSSEICKLLAPNTNHGKGFDRRFSGLALFLYKSLPSEKLKYYRAEAELMFSGLIDPNEFLSKLDCGLIRTIALASAEMVPTRRVKLIKFVDGLVC